MRDGIEEPLEMLLAQNLIDSMTEVFVVKKDRLHLSLARNILLFFHIEN